MRDFFGILFIVVLVFAVVIGLIVILVAVSQQHACQAYAEMGIQVRYNFWTGCMAHHSQFGWIPTEEYFKVLNLNVPQ